MSTPHIDGPCGIFLFLLFTNIPQSATICEKYNKGDRMAAGSVILKKECHEVFAAAIVAGEARADAYMKAYPEESDRAKAGREAWRLLIGKKIRERIKYLGKGKIVLPNKPKYISTAPKQKKEKNLDTDGINLQSVLKTCRRAINSDEIPFLQKLRAIETLNKLGAFDDEANKDKGVRMDPAAICEYLSRFAAAPVEELKRIPGGLSGLMGRLMFLTKTVPADLIRVLSENEPKPEGAEPIEAKQENLSDPATVSLEPQDGEKVDFG